MARGSTEPLRLGNGSRVAVIGGGPAGCFFVLHLLDMARRRGLHLQVDIFENKDFSQPGPAGCNKCAGVLSSRLLHNLPDLHLTLPPEVTLSEIKSYVLHLEEVAIEISRPEPWRRIVTVYRGAGPRLGHLPATVSLDAWLLNQARQRGANLIGERVTEVRTAGRPLVITRNSRLTCDLVVLATGVNHRPVQLPELNYVPPVTRIMSQDELLISDSANEQRIDIFSGYGVGALFVGLIPKGRFTSISILDHEQKKDNIGQFLKMRSQQAMLTSNPLRVCGCNPRIAVSPAQNYYADRFVTVGDAAVTRLYKDGIGSAFLTARQAACVALEVGVSKAAFQQRYAPFCRNIERDNRIGRLLFILWDRMQSSRRLRRAWLNVLLAEEALAAPAQHGRRAVWSMFTGDDSYRAILLQLLNLSILLRFLTGLLWPRLRPR